MAATITKPSQGLPFILREPKDREKYLDQEDSDAQIRRMGPS